MPAGYLDARLPRSEAPASTSSASAASALILPDPPRPDEATKLAELSARWLEVEDTPGMTPPAITRDGKTLVFLRRVGGATWPQLHAAGIATPERASRLVGTDARITGYALSDDGNTVFFLTQRGPEDVALHRVGIDGRSYGVLTSDGARIRDLPGGDAAGVAFFSARSGDAPSGSIYAVPSDGSGAPTRRCGAATSSILLNVARDGGRAIVLDLRSVNESAAEILDLTTGATRALWPDPKGAASSREFVNAAAFSPDGAHVYVATDLGGDALTLLRLDSKTLQETARFTETTAGALVASMPMATKADAPLVVMLQSGPRSEVRVLDSVTLKPRASVAMPLGVGTFSAITADGSVATLAWSTGETPYSLYGIETATGKVRPISTVGGGALHVETVTSKVRSFDGLEIPVNVYRPKGDDVTTGAKRPTLVVLPSSPTAMTARWSTFERYFTERGFVVVEANVRGALGFGRAFRMLGDAAHRADSVRDVEEVSRWAASQPWCDPRRMALFGQEYGGYLALMAIERAPERFAAAVELDGAYDLLGMLAKAPPDARALMTAELGSDDPEVLKTLSPATAVDRIATPLFVGATEGTMADVDARLLVARLRDRRRAVEFVVGPGGLDERSRDRASARWARIATFLQRAMPPSAK